MCRKFQPQAHRFRRRAPRLRSRSPTSENNLHEFRPGRLADELGFARAESLATERSTPSLVRFQADMLWKVHFRGSSRYLLLQLEFQSAPERYMTVRALCYVALHYHGLIGTRERRKELAPRRTAAAGTCNYHLQWPTTLDRHGRHVRPD